MAANNLNMLRMGGGGAGVQPQQILIQSPQQHQGQIMATTANGATVFLNAQNQIVGTGPQVTQASAGGSAGTSTTVQVKQEKTTS